MRVLSVCMRWRNCPYIDAAVQLVSAGFFFCCGASSLARYCLPTSTIGVEVVCVMRKVAGGFDRYSRPSMVGFCSKFISSLCNSVNV